MINPEHMKIIPAGLQFTDVVITGEHASLPDELLHKTRFTAKAADGTVFFDQALPVHMLSNRSLAVTFEPETIEDQEIMNAYGGLDNTPLYLVHLRPVLTVDGVREVVGQGGLAAGSDFTLGVELIAPVATEQVENIFTMGYPAVIGLAAQQAVTPGAVPREQKNAERLLFEQAVEYIDQGNKTEEELASLLQMQIARPLPTLVTLGGVLDVVSLLDAPQGYEWKGLYLDADLRTVETIGGIAPAGTTPASLFMKLASLQNSLLENRIFEDGFEVESVSTAKLLALAHDSDIPVTVIDSSNIDSVLPTLNLPESIRVNIVNGVNQGSMITIPETELIYEDWYGFSWIKEDPATHESGWMLSGDIAGGMTAWSLDRWPDFYRDRLTHPHLDPPNTDPDSGYAIRKITMTDMQTAEVGTTLNKKMQVIVHDRDNIPVAGANVTFSVKAGGGSFSDNGDAITVITDINGIAETEYTLGKCTGTCTESDGSPLPQGNPTYKFREPSDAYHTQVGENIISASLDSGVSITTPFTHYATPGDPVKIDVLPGSNSSGYVLTWIGFTGVKIVDQYSNPVANVSVDFSVADPVAGKDCPENPNKDERPALLIENEAPCMKTVPLYGQCGAGSVYGVNSHTTGEASVQVVLGGMPEADYVITVDAASMKASTAITVNTYPFGSCAGYSFPWSRIIINSPYKVDGNGNFASAAKVGSTLPMQAKVYWIMENGTTMSLDTICDNGTFQCAETIVGARDYKIITEFDSESVTFDGQLAVSSGQGQDRIFDVMYDVGDIPGKKSVVIHADTKKQILVNKDVCSNNCRVENETLNLYDDMVVDVYAVDIAIDQEILVPLNERGYALYDVKIPFAILPEEYRSGSTTVVLTKDGTPIQYIPAERQGQGFAEIAAGFQFDRDSTYTARIILDMGSEYMEVQSNEITLIPVTINLDADLNFDGIFSEGDPQESIAPGLIVPLNSDDDDKDGIPDYLDGFDLDPAVPEDDSFSDPADPDLADDELIAVKLHGLPVDFGRGTVTLEILAGQDNIRILADNKKEKGRDSILIDTTDLSAAATQEPIPASYDWQLGSAETPVLQDLPPFIYIEGINPSAVPGDIQLSISFTPEQGPKIEFDTLVLTVVQLELKVDENRDGKIVFGSPDMPERKYIYWVNDDHDKEHWEEGEWHEDDEEDDYIIPVDKQDWKDDFIGRSGRDEVNGNKRDLEDFAMIQLRVPKEIYDLPDLSYSFQFVNVVEDDGSKPSINMFKASDRTDLYLKMEASANKQIKEKKLLTIPSDEDAPIDRENISPEGQITPFIFEGRSKGSGDLKFLVKNGDRVIFETSVHLELHNIRWFYDEFKVEISSGSTWKARVENNYRQVNQGGYVGEKDNDEYFLFVHGWNVTEAERKRWTETIFKRFWWQGYKGKVGLFNWPTLTWADSLLLKSFDLNNFNNSEFIAWQSAESLSKLLRNLNVVQDKKLAVLAHSQGNVVTGEAIAKYSTSDKKIDAYIATQAALSTSYYDNTVVTGREVATGGFWGVPVYFSIKSPRIFGHYSTGQNNDVPYFAHTANKIGDKILRMYNFYNADDYALRKNIWGMSNMIVKPWYGFTYSSHDGEHHDTYDEEIDDFFGHPYFISGEGLEPALTADKLYLGNDLERYQIFTYIVKARFRPLGTQKIDGGLFDECVNLGDEKTYKFDKEHYSHSRQFRSNVTDEYLYWKKVLQVIGF
ncbi:MAG: alpha/beta hydrolase [Desulfobulbaceae bacterium]|nr:alpha/beta hydrolase [Desulfobulbaceae bacterium]